MINGAITIAGLGTAWWLGKKVLNAGISFFGGKATEAKDKLKVTKDKLKEKVKEKIPEDSFFGKHWGKLLMLAGSIFGLSKLPDGFW